MNPPSKFPVLHWFLPGLFSTDESAPLDGKTNRNSKIMNRAKTPFLGLQRLESTFLLRPDDPEPRQNTIPGISTRRTNVAVAT
eukprot:3953379-Pyramimonas_sp.AAC.1